MELNNGDICILCVYSWYDPIVYKRKKTIELKIAIDNGNSHIIYLEISNDNHCIMDSYLRTIKNKELLAFIKQHIEPYLEFLHNCTRKDEEKILPANNQRVICTLAKLF